MARGHIRRRAKSSWTVVLSLGNDPMTGKRRQKWITVRGTKRDAEAELARLLTEYERGIVPRSGRLTMALGARFDQLDINPLVYARGKWTALDAKLMLQPGSFGRPEPSPAKDPKGPSGR